MNANEIKSDAGAAATVGRYRPELTFYHPNAKGTGCAISMALHPAHDDTDGSIWLRMANQLTVGDRRAPVPTYPRFDWENSINVKLDFADLSKILQVFRGEIETLEDGKGLYHRSPRYTTRIVLRHLLEPTSGYSLEVYRNANAGGEESRAHIVFSSWEATGLMESIAGVMGVVSFGIPMLVPRDKSAYEADTRAMRQANAGGARDAAAA